jgi:hypothetical protein
MRDAAAVSDAVVQAQPLIAVRNVRAISHWYKRLLDGDALLEHPHRDLYERIWRDGRLVLQLQAWDDEDHPNLVNPDAAPPGHGVVLWFQVEDFDAAVAPGHAAPGPARPRWTVFATWMPRSSRDRSLTLVRGTGRYGYAILTTTSS